MTSDPSVEATVEQTVVSHVQALRAAGVTDEHMLLRAAVQALLAKGFPTGMVNDASFQQVVDSVVVTIESDEALSEAYRRLVIQRGDPASAKSGD
ncbi:hypothetical protein [Burkholderia ubonensis]|uniref:hypothetical protein n=1 Tax=Burkholderia ubonensis TaxID=101571 RepID=UPI0012BAB190|nr:hypothetical protein [Burkholderia ubonensis]